MKLGLASNFENEVDNVESIWNIFKDIIDKWTVVDSGSLDGTQDKLRELAGDKLNLIELDMIKTNGYGYSRTKLVEYSSNMDWVLIIDGDERMLQEDVIKLKILVDANLDYDLIWLPRVHWQDFAMTKVEYGSMDRIGSDYREALKINPDWQPRLIRRTLVNGTSKVQFYRRVHELIEGADKVLRSYDNPVIHHFGWLKSVERKQFIVDLCNKLYNMDKENLASYIPDVKVPICSCGGIFDLHMDNKDRIIQGVCKCGNQQEIFKW